MPQGYVLGPLLCNIFINNIVRIEGVRCILFADDAIFHIDDESFNTAIVCLNEFIGNLSEWTNNNRIIGT